ncbi:molybdopterin-dependent oxidoreductase [Nocardioides humi]|uniref:molybdopterin-dependent oxidoreductase n=1 Tax=Nocardioides humi TaxID=449461 RepID=UPI0015E87079|nr:molybdopterin-dependent oxidoreductase [Nocardioides humi]
MIEQHSFCRVCVNGCSILVRIEDGRATKVRADPTNPVYRGYTCFRGRALPELMADPRRQLHSTALQPDGTRRRVGADQAMDEIAERLQGVIETHGPDSVALYTGMAVSKCQPLLTLAHSFADRIGVTRRWSANTLDQPGKQIAHGLHGYWLAPPQAFDEPEVVLWVGINPLMSYMGLPMGSPRRFFKECEKRGTTLIMVDPRRTEAARRSTRHLQPRPGQDVAILACLVRTILIEGLYDREFVESNVDGLDALNAAVAPFTPEVVSLRADLPAEDLLWTARTFAAAKRGYVVAGTGPNMGTARGTVLEYLVLALDTLCGHYLRAGEVVRTPGTLTPGPCSGPRHIHRWRRSGSSPSSGSVGSPTPSRGFRSLRWPRRC